MTEWSKARVARMVGLALLAVAPTALVVIMPNVFVECGWWTWPFC